MLKHILYELNKKSSNDFLEARPRQPEPEPAQPRPSRRRLVPTIGQGALAASFRPSWGGGWSAYFPTTAVAFAPFANWPCISNKWRKRYQDEAVWMDVFSGSCLEPPCTCPGCAVRMAKRIPSALSKLSLDFRRSTIGDLEARAVAEQLPGTLAQLTLDFTSSDIGDGHSVGKRSVFSFSSALSRPEANSTPHCRICRGIAGFVI